MSESKGEGRREGSLEAPTRHALDWKNPAFRDEQSLFAELERIFDICHGCRRCVSLCHAFPTLFDLVDGSTTMEVDGVAKADYWKVVDQCYLCDLCYQTKCPYVPPHEWNLDFPHQMLRAKAFKFGKGETSAAHRLLSNTRTVGKLASIPVVVEAVNAGNRSPTMRGLIEKTLGVDRRAHVPVYHSRTAQKALRHLRGEGEGVAAGPTRGRVAIFATCYGNYNMPAVVEDLAAILGHNGIPVRMVGKEQCCGMPKMELGDLESVERFMLANLPALLAQVDAGYDLIAPIPSCVLMFKQELPLMFPEHEGLKRVRAAFFDPFEYLSHRHRAGLLKTTFPNSLGKVAYHVPCHQRVQNIGPRTRDILGLVPGTEFELIERCSGHDGTYGVRKATYDLAVKIARPVATRAKNANPDHLSSDCPMAGDHIAHVIGEGRSATHPISLLRRAYGI